MESATGRKVVERLRESVREFPLRVDGPGSERRQALSLLSRLLRDFVSLAYAPLVVGRIAQVCCRRRARVSFTSTVKADILAVAFGCGERCNPYRFAAFAVHCLFPLVACCVFGFGFSDFAKLRNPRTGSSPRVLFSLFRGSAASHKIEVLCANPVGTLKTLYRKHVEAFSAATVYVFSFLVSANCAACHRLYLRFAKVKRVYARIEFLSTPVESYLYAGCTPVWEQGNGGSESFVTKAQNAVKLRGVDELNQ